MKESKDFFWPSYVDLMTALFLTMLVMFVLSFKLFKDKQRDNDEAKGQRNSGTGERTAHPAATADQLVLLVGGRTGLDRSYDDFRGAATAGRNPVRYDIEVRADPRARTGQQMMHVAVCELPRPSTGPPSSNQPSRPCQQHPHFNQCPLFILICVHLCLSVVPLVLQFDL